MFIFFSTINIFSQENKELKKIKCLKRMPVTCEKLQKNDTIYILYHKSNLIGFEQNKIDIENYERNSYYFYGYIHFPLDIYDYDGFEKVNYRKPIEMYKTESFICKNINKVIDINFLKKCGYKFHADFYDEKKIIFVIDLDIKVKNKYKIVQVNKPIYIEE
jgi:hypothetical protein